MNKQIKSIINKIHSLKGKKGKMVAIETKTGKWFLGNSPLDVIQKGEEMFPDSVFYIIKVGFRAAGMMKHMN